MNRRRMAALVVLLALTLGVSPAMAGGRTARPGAQVQGSAWSWLWQQVDHLSRMFGGSQGTMDPNGDPAAPTGTQAAPNPTDLAGTDAQGTMDPDGSSHQ